MVGRTVVDCTIMRLEDKLRPGLLQSVQRLDWFDRWGKLVNVLVVDRLLTRILVGLICELGDVSRSREELWIVLKGQLY